MNTQIAPSPEYQYLMENKQVLVAMARRQRQAQLEQGNAFNEKAFIQDFCRNVRDQKVDIDVPLKQNLQAFEQTQVKHYVTLEQRVNPPTFIRDTINELPESRDIKEEIYRLHGKELIQGFEIHQTKRGTKTSTHYFKRRISNLASQIKENRQAEQSVKQGKLTPDDKRRLNRMQVLIRNNQKMYQQHGMRFQARIDGTSTSHIAMLFKDAKGREIQFLVAPSQIVNYSLKKVIYNRESINSTLTEFKTNVPNLQANGITGEALKVFVKFMGDSLDLRKTVKDEQGKRY